MNVIYEDEYGNELLSIGGECPLSAGDSVVLGGETYRIQSKTIYPEQHNTIVVSVTQNMVKSKATENPESGRHNALKNAILATNNRQDVIEKKHKALNEQIVSVKKHVNQQLRKENKHVES